MSPSPNCEPVPGTTSSWSMTGRIVRTITFQFSESENGTTGWMFT